MLTNFAMIPDCHKDKKQSILSNNVNIATFIV